MSIFPTPNLSCLIKAAKGLTLTLLSIQQQKMIGHELSKSHLHIFINTATQIIRSNNLLFLLKAITMKSILFLYAILLVAVMKTPPLLTKT